MTESTISGRGLSRARRLVAALVAAMQIAVPPVVAVADGRIDARAIAEGSRSHIESDTSLLCPRVHSLDCALCHFLTTATGASAAASPDLPSGADDGRPSAASLFAAGNGTGTLPHSRAPPHLS